MFIEPENKTLHVRPRFPTIENVHDKFIVRAFYCCLALLWSSNFFLVDVVLLPNHSVTIQLSFDAWISRVNCKFNFCFKACVTQYNFPCNLSRDVRQVSDRSQRVICLLHNLFRNVFRHAATAQSKLVLQSEIFLVMYLTTLEKEIQVADIMLRAAISGCSLQQFEKNYKKVEL